MRAVFLLTASKNQTIKAQPQSHRSSKIKDWDWKNSNKRSALLKVLLEGQKKTHAERSVTLEASLGIKLLLSFCLFPTLKQKFLI